MTIIINKVDGDVFWHDKSTAVYSELVIISFFFRYILSDMRNISFHNLKSYSIKSQFSVLVFGSENIYPISQTSRLSIYNKHAQ
jgi:hypothetical protein